MGSHFDDTAHASPHAAFIGIQARRLLQTSSKGAKYLYLFVDALCALWRKDSQGARLFVNAQKGIPGNFDLLKPDAAHYLIAPVMALASMLPSIGMEFDAKDFNATLARALKLHKKFWSSGKKRKLDPEGLLSIDLLGVTAMGYDQGMEISVESDYIPAHLLRGDPFTKTRQP
jgi:hypothetical protein